MVILLIIYTYYFHYPMDLQHYYDFYGPHNAVEIQLRFQQVQSIYKIDTKNTKLVSFVCCWWVGLRPGLA